MTIPQKTKEKKEVKAEELKYYTVKLDVLVPATLTYNILALNPEEAIKQIENKGIISQLTEQPILRWAKAKKIIYKIYKSGTSMLEYSKVPK